jgi:hypothetical protein
MLGRKSPAAITSRSELRTASLCSNHVTPALRWHNVPAPLERGDRDLFGAACDGVDGGPTEQCGNLAEIPSERLRMLIAIAGSRNPEAMLEWERQLKAGQ